MGRPYPNIFFAAYGFGPYLCFFCHERTVEFGEVHIHHIDCNKQNNHPLNLAPAHASCHRRWHVQVEGIANRGHGTGGRPKGSTLTPEHRAKISRAQMGKPATKGRTGQPHTAQTKAKMAAARRAWWERKHAVSDSGN